jgi:cytochrome c-type biogenesis protein CcmF
VIYRLPLLRSRNELESWVSREAAFLVNNWILLFSAFLVLFATMFPTLSEALSGQRLTVGPPFFNTWMVPVGLILLVLTGVGPLLAWRKSSVSNLRYQFLWPAVTAATTAAIILALGIRVWSSGLCFIFAGFVFGTITQEFWRGAAVRQRSTGTDALTAMVGLVGRSRRRYGGYIVHVGIVLMFLGFAGQGFKQVGQFPLKSGEEGKLGPYTFKLDTVKLSDDGAKQMMTAHVSVLQNGQTIAAMYPAKWYFRKHEEEPTTEVAIRRGPGEDLYIVMHAFDLKNRSAALEVTINPLVNWIWLGFAVMALGTGLALLPERTFAFAMAKLPEGVTATTAALLMALALAMPIRVHAQHGGGPATSGSEIQTSFYARTPFEKQMQREIVCTCGACGHAAIGECRKDPCGVSHQMREELAALIDQNKSHDEIIQWFVAKYGTEEMLGSPMNKGLRPLAWVFPYAVAGTAALVGGFLFIRRTRQTVPERVDPADTEDAALQARLDRELEDLD